MLAGLIAVGITIALFCWFWQFAQRKDKAWNIPLRGGSKIAVLGRPSRGKLLRKLAARARRDYPGQSEEWYWKRANEELKRYRR